MRLMEGKNAPVRKMSGPEGVGVALACPLTGHMSKGHDKGGYGINAPVLGIKAAVGG
jgi:hypothetical protein